MILISSNGVGESSTPSNSDTSFNIRHMKPALRSFPALCLQCVLAGFLVLGCQSPSVGQIESQPARSDYTLRRDLVNLWDGSWIEIQLRPTQSRSVQEAGLEAALRDHRDDFSSRIAVDREWQLAEMRSSLSQPNQNIRRDHPFLFDRLNELSRSIVDEYTQLHEDLFDRDTEWERLRSQVFIDFEGNTARSGELLARSINYTLERTPEASDLKLQEEVFTVIDRRVQDYLFAFNNGTATNRRQINAAWEQGIVSFQPAGSWQLNRDAANRYDDYLTRYQQVVNQLKEDLADAFRNPKFVTRRGISPAVGDILQLLSENYFEFETYSRWFSENEELMNEALVIVDMRTRATPHEVVKLDPVTLEPTDLNDGLRQTEFVETIAEKRRELLLKYLAIREEVNAEIEEEIVRRKGALSAEEEEVLWREYQKMKELTRTEATAPSTTVP